VLNNYGKNLSQHLSDLMPTNYIEGEGYLHALNGDTPGIYFHPNIFEGQIIQLDKMGMILPGEEVKDEIDNHIVHNLLPKIQHPVLKKTAKVLCEKFEA
jgi:hypothetical protein